jgi:hypothetical protein
MNGVSLVTTTVLGGCAEQAIEQSATPTAAMLNKLELRMVVVSEDGGTVHKNAYRRCLSPKLWKIRQRSDVFVARNLFAPIERGTSVDKRGAARA